MIHVPTQEETREARRREYLKAWPVSRQLEALTEAAAGRPEKEQRMKEDFAEIRRVLPYFENSNENEVEGNG